MPPNKPAAGNAGIASRLTIEHHWPGVPEPERSTFASGRALPTPARIWAGCAQFFLPWPLHSPKFRFFSHALTTGGLAGMLGP